jgi:hypothetical protein
MVTSDLNPSTKQFRRAIQAKESTMNAIAKIIAPAALVFASFSANAAGLIETDYPLEPFGAATVSSASASTGPSFSGLDIHYPGSMASGEQVRSRADVMREVQANGNVGTKLPVGGSNA